MEATKFRFASYALKLIKAGYSLSEITGRGCDHFGLSYEVAAEVVNSVKSWQK